MPIASEAIATSVNAGLRRSQRSAKRTSETRFSSTDYRDEWIAAKRSFFVLYTGRMPDPAERLRALHHGPPILVLPNAWDAASARLFEAEGFPAVATTSAGVAAALGYPDGGIVPSREMIEAVSRIVRAVKVP